VIQTTNQTGLLDGTGGLDEEAGEQDGDGKIEEDNTV
jgi:hypothetical protein